MLKGTIPSRTTSPEGWAGIDGLDPLHRLVLDTAYDQTAALDVPVFDPGAKVKVVGYREKAAAGLLLKGALPPLLAAAAAAVGCVFSTTQRFEPSNQTAIHRSYPSPRSLYPVAIDFVFIQPHREYRCRYDPEHHALIGDVAGFGAEPWGLRLEVVGVLDRISPLYGDLGPTLCALEAGHIAAQLRDALVAHGLDPVGQFAGTPGAAQREATNGLEDNYLVATFACPAPPVAWRPAPDQIVPLRVAAPLLNDGDRKRVARAYARLCSPPLAAVPMPAPLSCGLARALAAHERDGRLRSSGHFPHGISSDPVAPEAVDGLLGEIVALYRGLMPEATDPDLRVHLLRPRPDGTVEVLDPADTSGPRLDHDGRDALATAFGSSYNIDLATVPLFVLFSGRFARVVRRPSSWAYIQTLAAAGLLAQHICVAAAKRGFYARPFKGIIAKAVESGFDLPGQVFYSIVLGRRTPPLPCYSIGSLGVGQ